MCEQGEKLLRSKEDGARLRVHSAGIDCDDADSDTFSNVVNALWDGRLAIDATLGIHPGRKWIYRFKHGIRFQLFDYSNLSIGHHCTGTVWRSRHLWRRLVLYFLVSCLHDRSLQSAGAARLAGGAGTNHAYQRSSQSRSPPWERLFHNCEVCARKTSQ